MAAGTLTATTAMGNEINLHEGLWETVTTVKMEGMPVQMQVPPFTHRQCLTKQKMIPQKKEDQQKCKITKQELSGNTLKWEMKCTGEGPAEIKGEITYRGDSFEGISHAVVTNPGTGTIKITNKMTGRYIGECTQQ